MVTGDWVIFPNHYKVSPLHTGVLLSSSNEIFLIDFPSNEREGGVQSSQSTDQNAQAENMKNCTKIQSQLLDHGLSHVNN